MSPAMRRASYAIIPIGVAGIIIGAYEAVVVSAVPGVIVALLGLGAAATAVSRLRRTG